MPRVKDQSKLRQYALYHGDRFVDLGTADYLADLMGIKSHTVRFLASPTYARRRKADGSSAIVIRIDDKEENE